MDASLEIQTYIVQLLGGDPTLVAATADPSDGGVASATCGVYDDVPQGAPFPYVKIGDDTLADDDDKTDEAAQHTFTIHTWSRARGRAEVKRLQARIKHLLHDRPFNTESAQVYLSKMEFETSSDDPDGRTRHGVQRFRFLATQSHP